MWRIFSVMRLVPAARRCGRSGFHSRSVDQDVASRLRRRHVEPAADRARALAPGQEDRRRVVDDSALEGRDAARCTSSFGRACANRVERGVDGWVAERPPVLTAPFECQMLVRPQQRRTADRCRSRIASKFALLFACEISSERRSSKLDVDADGGELSLESSSASRSKTRSADQTREAAGAFELQISAARRRIELNRRLRRCRAPSDWPDGPGSTGCRAAERLADQLRHDRSRRSAAAGFPATRSAAPAR